MQTLTLLAGEGIEGDYHLGGERQVCLWDSAAKKDMQQLGYRGLCMRRFSANVLLNGLRDAHIHAGDTLRFGNAAIRITHVGKHCFPDACELAHENIACPLQCCMYGVVRNGGVITVGDVIVHKSI